MIKKKITFYFCFQLLNREREENQRLIKLLDDKDRRIAELEKEIALLNKVR